MSPHHSDQFSEQLYMKTVRYRPMTRLLILLHRANLLFPSLPHTRMKLAVKWESPILEPEQFLMYLTLIFTQVCSRCLLFSCGTLSVYLCTQVAGIMYSGTSTYQICYYFNLTSFARLVENKSPGNLTLKQWGRFTWSKYLSILDLFYNL